MNATTPADPVSVAHMNVLKECEAFLVTLLRHLTNQCRAPTALYHSYITGCDYEFEKFGESIPVGLDLALGPEELWCMKQASDASTKMCTENEALKRVQAENVKILKELLKMVSREATMHVLFLKP